jgi:hypothetical protein
MTNVPEITNRAEANGQFSQTKKQHYNIITTSIHKRKSKTRTWYVQLQSRS